FARNYVSPTQLADLTRDIRSAKSSPLLIAVDQEGGRVQRFTDSFTRLPALRLIGDLYDRDPDRACCWARAVGTVLASELVAVGVDFSFAPVLDLASANKTIGERAFHKNPNIVRLLGSQFALGMKRCGMRAVAKHFPGHSGVIEDPHIDFPKDFRSLNEIQLTDTKVYQGLDPDLFGGIMTCHVGFSAVDDLPATLSSRWLRQELRERLHFTGVIFSDDLMMGALREITDPAERALKAFTAGCDMMLLCNDQPAIDFVLDSVHLSPRGEKMQARIEKMQLRDIQGPTGQMLIDAKERVINPEL
ncbi:beta-N-acetylhexosaminidase, partial [Gammaproteobacteria bacterium]|nr:beta-N-acetylhexosaminidase [Gammaproteobacteria bacterium]